MTLKRTACLFLCIYTPLFSVTATEADDLFALSFEDLLEVHVDIGSKTLETLASAPSTITVFKRQDIAALGVDNAYELMNYVPGMQSTRGDWVGAVPKDHARGVYLDSGNILVMINGERLNESSFGKASVYTPFIPVSIIEKVEFIRGPGSALYGSNAFLGVMNIVTKQQHNEVQLAAGNNGYHSFSGHFHSEFAAQHSAFLTFAYDHKEGETYPQKVKDPLTAFYFEAGLDYQQLQIRSRYNKTNLDRFLNLGGYSNKNQHSSENRYFGINYSWLKTAQSSLTTRLSYTEHHIESAGLIIAADDMPTITNDFLVGPAWQTTDTQFVTEVNHLFSNDWQVAAGIEYLSAEQVQADVRTNYYDPQSLTIVVAEQYYQQGVVTISDFVDFAMLKQRFETSSVYSQLKIPYSNKLTLFVGGRYDYVQDIDSKLSPRLASVYQYNDKHTFKLQYGESFRTPVTNELYSNDDVTIGNANLKSEYIKTTELVWHYQLAKYKLNSVLFHNQLNDFINKIAHPSQQNKFTFANELNTHNSGLELSSQWQLENGLNLAATYTQYFQEPMNASFKRFATLTVGYQFSQDWLLNLNTIWRDTVTQPVNNGTQFEQPAYTLFGGSLQWRLSDHSEVRLTAKNIFAKRYNVYDPRVDNGAVAGAGDQISLHYRIRF